MIKFGGSAAPDRKHGRCLPKYIFTKPLFESVYFDKINNIIKKCVYIQDKGTEEYN